MGVKSLNEGRNKAPHQPYIRDWVAGVKCKVIERNKTVGLLLQGGIGIFSSIQKCRLKRCNTLSAVLIVQLTAKACISSPSVCLCLCVYVCASVTAVASRSCN